MDPKVETGDQPTKWVLEEPILINKEFFSDAINEISQLEGFDKLRLDAQKGLLTYMVTAVNYFAEDSSQPRPSAQKINSYKKRLEAEQFVPSGLIETTQLIAMRAVFRSLRNQAPR